VETPRGLFFASAPALQAALAQSPDRQAALEFQLPARDEARIFIGAETAQAQAPELRTFVGAAPVNRWSGSAWLLVRGGEAQSLAAGGMLGGSQAGARLGYRINGDAARPLALTARLYTPARRPEGAEAAVGVEWQPLARLPVRLLAERRQAIGDEGRSAFSLTAYGGMAERKLAGPVRLDAYAQAGIVGLRSRDLFFDGSATVGVGIGEGGMFRLGAGVWGAAQSGASRLDAGPSLSLRAPAFGRNVRISADWRMRLAGDAAPGSGPALTVGTDF
jgi:hypothetical protein